MNGKPRSERASDLATCLSISSHLFKHRAPASAPLPCGCSASPLPPLPIRPPPAPLLLLSQHMGARCIALACGTSRPGDKEDDGIEGTCEGACQEAVPLLVAAFDGVCHDAPVLAVPATVPVLPSPAPL